MFFFSFIVSSGKTWTGVPIIAANMDTTGTFAMAKVFAKHKMLVAMSKHIEVDEVGEFLYACVAIIVYAQLLGTLNGNSTRG